MGGSNVKNTMVQRLLQVIAPDLCYSCGKIGTVFCHHCKYDIMHDTVAVCFWCDTPTPMGVCGKHNTNIDQVFMVGPYSGGLKHAIEGVKFHNDRFATDALAELIDSRVSQLPSDTIVVPVPTIRENIRKRGYDQALLIAKGFAARRGLSLKPIVRRVGAFIQHDTESRVERETQTKGAFTLTSPAPSTVVLVDDVVTTGSTVNEIARVLREAGTEHVYVAAVAHPL